MSSLSVEAVEVHALSGRSRWLRPAALHGLPILKQGSTGVGMRVQEVLDLLDPSSSG